MLHVGVGRRFANRGLNGDPSLSLSLPFSAMSTGADLLNRGVSFSRVSGATQYDSTGQLTWAPNNLLLNSATLATQSVTTSAMNYILSFQGTGTVTLSGASTAGPLVGTGTSNTVALKFTAIAGTLTLTVSGSVTSAQLEAVTYQTAPRPYIATTVGAVYGPRFDYDPVTLLPLGLLIEEQRTNLGLWSGDLSNAVWATSNNVTKGAASSAPDGSSTARTITYAALATAGLEQTLTISASTTYTISVWAKVASGTKTFRLKLWDRVADQFSSDFTATTTWQRFSFPVTSAAGTFAPNNFSIANGTNAAAGNLILWGAQIEAGAFATSYIPTQGAAGGVARSPETATITGTAFSSFFNAAAGTFVVEHMQTAPVASAFGVMMTTPVAAGSYLAMSSDANHIGWYANGLATVGNETVGAFNKTAIAYAGTAMDAVRNGGAVVTSSSSDFTGSCTALKIGQASAGNNYSDGWIRSITFYKTRQSNAKLQSLTT